MFPMSSARRRSLCGLAGVSFFTHRDGQHKSRLHCPRVALVRRDLQESEQVARTLERGNLLSTHRPDRRGQEPRATAT